MFKVSVRTKFAILHNFTFLSGSINLKVIFKIKKKTPQKLLYLPLVILRERFFFHIKYLIESRKVLSIS